MFFINFPARIYSDLACFEADAQLQGCNTTQATVVKPPSRYYFACAVMIFSAKAENTPANR